MGSEAGSAEAEGEAVLCNVAGSEAAEEEAGEGSVDHLVVDLADLRAVGTVALQVVVSVDRRAVASR